MAVSAALVAAAIVLGGRAAGPSGRVGPGAAAISSPAPGPRSYGGAAGLRANARRFLVAFTRYEVGDRSAGVVEVLNSTSTRSFVGTLLEEPRPAAPALPGSARLEQLSVAVISDRPPSATVDAVARRVSGPEQLAFLFVRRKGAWLAAAPGE